MFCEHDWEGGRLLKMDYGERELNKYYAQIESDMIKENQKKIEKSMK